MFQVGQLRIGPCIYIYIYIERERYIYIYREREREIILRREIME